MFRLRQGLFLWVVFCISLGLNLMGVGHAESRYQLKSPTGEELQLTTVNQKREADSLVLYTPEYGSSSRTNPYGIEVSATPLPGSANHYKVVQVTSQTTCQDADDLQKCGNIAIPKNGIVLSATGNKRPLLSQSFQPGAVFELSPVLIYNNRIHVSATDPTAETNPTGSGFPGFRGGNQMIIYDSLYGEPTTGTNEFGYEVTVKGGRVVEQEGANSSIPTDPESFVLSGHGKAREWLLQNAPVGSKIERQDDMIISNVDKDTYLYQLDHMVAKIQAMGKQTLSPAVLHQIDALKLTAPTMSDDAVAQAVLKLKQDLTSVLWASYPAVPASTLRGIWHRPSEKSVTEIRQSLDLLKKAGFNTLFLETYLHGDPIFPSRTFKAYHIPQNLPFQLADKNEDLLQVWLDEAHKRNMKVHVWFQTFYAGNQQYDKTVGSILTTYPQWANIQHSGLDKGTLPPSTLEAGGYFLDPANQDAQGFLLSLIDEIITRYPVDGFQLDYIRYPASFPPDRYSYLATTWGYTPIARELFKNRSGMDPVDLNPADNPELWADWNDFKTRQVDRFVMKAHDLIKMKRPEMPISVAVFPKAGESLSRKHQNWVAWAQNGWVDDIAPMTLTSSLETISTDTREVKNTTDLPVITGVFGPFNGNSPSEVVDQVWAAVSAGATGVALFDTAHLTQKMAEALHMGLFKDPPKQ